jgi:site-specific recombinase XerD
MTAMPAAADWFANIVNPRTRRAYQTDLEYFCSFVGLATADEFGMVTRSHVLAWRAQLETHGLAGSTICRKPSTLASLFDHLLDAVTGGDPIYSVIRPRMKPGKASGTVYAAIIERGKATGCCGHLQPNL